MATDLTKAPLEILVDLINDTNGCALTTSDITFGPPSSIPNGARNTGLRITATASSVYSGSRDVTYDRIDMASIPGLRSTVFVLDGAKTIRDLIPKINNAYMLNLQPEDYYDDVLPVFEMGSDTVYHFTLRAKPASYIYRNWLVLTGGDNKLVIGDVIAQDLLSGFILPEITEELESTEILNGFFFHATPPV
jgi:hypothetical protein